MDLCDLQGTETGDGLWARNSLTHTQKNNRKMGPIVKKKLN